MLHTRLPGRVEGNTTFISAAELAATLRRDADAYGEHENRAGRHDANWPDWYAEYIVRKQANHCHHEAMTASCRHGLWHVIGRLTAGCVSLAAKGQQ